MTEANHTDEATGTATARPRRGAGQFSRLPIAQAALRFAGARHAHQDRDIDHAPFIAHPIEVGSLLRRDGQPDEIIAAGLLHDILEKTATTSAELHRQFGPHIARLVESVSDDPSLGDYRSRKRDLRDRVAHADPGTRAVFAADKIAKVRELALLPSHSSIGSTPSSTSFSRARSPEVPALDRSQAPQARSAASIELRQSEDVLFGLAKDRSEIGQTSGSNGIGQARPVCSRAATDHRSGGDQGSARRLCKGGLVRRRGC